MIEFFSLKLAESIKKSVPESATSIPVMKYALSIILNALMIIVFSLILSIFTGRTFNVMVSLTAFPLLRRFSGGYHMKSGMKCILFSTTLMTLISLSSFSYKFTFCIGIVSMILVGLFAPSNIRRQSRRVTEKDYPRLKLISLMIVASNFVIGSPTVASAFLAQSITLIRLKGGEKS